MGDHPRDAEGAAQRPLTGSHAEEHHPVVGRNPFLVLLPPLFVVIGGVVAVMRTPLDALPDLSDVQVIVYTGVPGQAPQVVEDQVTYPLTTAMLRCRSRRWCAAFVLRRLLRLRDLRGRHRHLLGAQPGAGIPELRARRACRKGVAGTGPDATGVGWSTSTRCWPKTRRWPNCAPSRTGTCATSSPRRGRGRGRFARRLRADLPGHRRSAEAARYGIPLAKVAGDPRLQPRRRRPGRRDGRDRVHGARQGLSARQADIEALVVKADKGTPVLIRDIARVELVPDERRGMSELNGEGEVVSGIAMRATARTRWRSSTTSEDAIGEISAGLPEGVSIEPVYDRSDLIHRAIDTLEAHAARREPDRRRGLRGLPAARALGAGGHPDAAGRRADRFIAMRPAGHELEPDEPGRHRHRHRRDGGRGHRDDRERHKHLERLPPRATARQRADAMLAACTEVGPALFLRC